MNIRCRNTRYRKYTASTPRPSPNTPQPQSLPRPPAFYQIFKFVHFLSRRKGVEKKWRKINLKEQPTSFIMWSDWGHVSLLGWKIIPGLWRNWWIFITEFTDSIQDIETDYSNTQIQHSPTLQILKY